MIVYCWCQTPSDVVSPRGEATPPGGSLKQCTHNQDWSLKHKLHYVYVPVDTTSMKFERRKNWGAHQVQWNNAKGPFY